MVPDTVVSVRDLFGIDLDLEVPAFSESSEHVPVVDEDYRFDQDTTLAILAGVRSQPKSNDSRLSWYR